MHLTLKETKLKQKGRLKLKDLQMSLAVTLGMSMKNM